MEIPAAVEHRRPYRETPAEKLGREIGSFFVALLRTAALTGILTPVLLSGFLLVDVPVRGFDVVFDAAALKPSLWLSVGGVVMSLALPLVLLIARRFGGDEASATITASWGVAAVCAFAGLSAMAPVLVQGDLPTVRFVAAFVASTLIGQYLAVGVYDVTRGGGPWWRAPLMSCLFGFLAQALIYFPWVYLSSKVAPLVWVSWMAFDIVLKLAIAVAFLPLYHMLLKPLRPRGGYGGR